MKQVENRTAEKLQMGFPLVRWMTHGWIGDDKFKSIWLAAWWAPWKIRFSPDFRWKGGDGAILERVSYEISCIV